MKLVPQTHNGVPFKDLEKVYIDFEYNQSSEQKMNLVSCSADEGELYSYWLHKDKQQKKVLKEYLLRRRDTHTFVAFNVIAEASSFISLGLDPTKFCWIDLQLEYKMLLNHWSKFRYGNQMIDGKVKKTTQPPRYKFDLTDKQRMALDMSKPQSSLVACTYKLLGVERDYEHKDKMRDLIISEPEDFTTKEREDIMKYCDEDVKDLPAIWAAIKNAYKQSTAKRAISMAEVHWRGETAARTALMTRLGYPVNNTAVENFSKSVNSIMNDIAEDINTQFPERGFFEWNKSTGRYSKKEAAQREWIDSIPQKDRWRKTEKGKHSLSLDSFSDHFTYRHNYPRLDIPAQILRYLKTKQSMNGFMPSKKKTFFDSFGSDGRARAWLNPYGSQSGRFQPSATGFIPLKSAWMRSLIQPPPGFGMVGIDYGSEEFLIAALLSGDEKMYEAYVSGDVYLHFAKLAGVVPMDGERKDYEGPRNKFKSTCLGIQYGMMSKGLSHKLTMDTGEETGEPEAQKLIDTFFSVFHTYEKWLDEQAHLYNKKGYLKLADGWTMFGDNQNIRSVLNCPVQGMGSCILRKSIQLAQQANLKINIPLHDALYAQFKEDRLERVDTLYDVMKEGFRHYFKNDDRLYEWSNAIRMDIDVWGDGFEVGVGRTPRGRLFKSQTIYVDPRSKNEFEQFQKYFTRQ